MVMKKLRDDLNLYGTNTANVIMHTKSNEFDNTNLYRRASKLLESTVDNTTVEYVPKFIIHPTSTFKTIWNWVVILLLLYTATCTPFFIYNSFWFWSPLPHAYIISPQSNSVY